MTPTRAELPNVTILNRPFKPLAVGLIVSTGTVGINSLNQLIKGSVLVPTPEVLSPVLGTLAIISITLMFVAWIIRNQRIYEISLILAVGAWAFRGIGLLLDGGGFAFMFPISMMIMAGGAFLLERADERATMG